VNRIESNRFEPFPNRPALPETLQSSASELPGIREGVVIHYLNASRSQK